MEKESITEKEWESHGFKCRAIFVRHSYRCGYVGIPKGHPAYEKSYSDLPIEAHGGLIYGRIEDDGLHWFGFDCAHAGDKLADSPPLFESDHFWTLEEVVDETERMAYQFSKLTLRDVIEEKLKWMPDWFKNKVASK